MSEKRYYWIKLKTDFFNQEAIDFLMSQDNGCEYIVLYQMLCLQTVNNGGEMSTRIGEMIVPYDVKKIVRDTKYFDSDTVIVALELFKKLSLVYLEEDNILRVANFDEMVGSESSSAKRVREHRARKALQGNVEVTPDVTQEKESRDKSLEIDKEKDTEKDKGKRKRFVPPSVDEVRQYCQERQNGIDAEAFVDFYASKGWKVGSQPMKDWKACVRTWERRAKKDNKTAIGPNGVEYRTDDEDNDEIWKKIWGGR